MAIRNDLAQSLMTRLREHLDCNINIMDDQGIIIASADTSRIGDFHEAAYRLIRDKLSIEVVRPSQDLPGGTKPGINLPIVYQDLILGVVGVTGDPDEIRNLAYAVKTSVETMVEYEYYKDEISRRQDVKNQFLGRLLYEHVEDPRELDDFAGKLGYTSDIIRVPILFQLPSSKYVSDVADVIKRSAYHTKQHMTFITVDKDILVFKPFRTDVKELFLCFKDEVKEYAASVEKELIAAKLSPFSGCFVGSGQNQYNSYRDAYRHTLWLISHLRKRGIRGEKVYFFSDYVMQYFFEAVPTAFYSQVFSSVEQFIDRSTKHMIISTIDALRQNNMSIKAASESLKIHRNTISFRLEKIRDQLGLDPLNSSEDLNLVIMLVEYLKVPYRVRR